MELKFVDNKSKWIEEFDKRQDQKQYILLATGKFVNLDNGEDTDEK